jgi:hypothetical protein
VSPRNDVEEITCEGSGVESGTSDDPTPDEETPGACCNTSTGCYITSEPECTAAGDTWHGAGLACSDIDCNDPSAACCYTDTSGTIVCDDITEGHCDQLSGTWSSGVSCDDEPTNCVLGSCCFTDTPHEHYGYCTEATEQECVDFATGGTYVTSWTEGGDCPNYGPCDD